SPGRCPQPSPHWPNHPARGILQPLSRGPAPPAGLRAPVWGHPSSGVLMDVLSGSVVIPMVLFVPGVLVVGLLLLWAYGVARDRNPLPFPDRDYQVFSAASHTGLLALEELMQHFGHRPRFRIDSEQVDRTVFSNGTIIN